MEIIRLITGEFQTNTYLIKDEDSLVVIDPSGNGNPILKEIGDANVSAILLTHGHFDHIKAVDKLYDKFKCPIYLNPSDEELVRNKAINSLAGHNAVIKSPIIFLNEGELIVDNFNFDVFFTPGHTKGSCVFKLDLYLFTGDTLFKNSVGRCDLYGGNERQMYDSLKLFRSFKDNLYILPGHDEPSTLYDELTYNPYL